MNRLLVSLLLILPVLTVTSAAESALAVNKQVSSSVTVSATVGEPLLTVFGYTSPHAVVKLEGTKVEQQTTANNQGYFLFDKIFLPAPQKRWLSNYKEELAYPELSLTAIDTDQHASFPISLPPLPIGSATTIGPVLLPPTVSLQKGKFFPQEQIMTSGQTIPGADVRIFLANKEPGTDNFIEKLLRFSPFSYIFPYHTYAYTLPSYRIAADEKGLFQFNLPANTPDSWKIFASASYLNSPSPKSNTLTFEILRPWHLNPYLWFTILLGTTFLLAIILILKSKNKKRQKITRV